MAEEKEFWQQLHRGPQLFSKHTSLYAIAVLYG